MGNINFGKENGNIQEGAQGGYQGGYQGEHQEGYQGNFQGTGETTFNGGMHEEKAGSIAGVLEQPQGYVGGFIGNYGNIQEQQQADSYVGGFISQNQQVQGVGYQKGTATEFDEKKLPVKRGFWSKFKALLFKKIDLTQEIRVELSTKEEKVLNEVHDFLFQELSFKGFMDILKIGNDKK